MTTIKSHFPELFQSFLGTLIHWRLKEGMGAPTLVLLLQYCGTNE